MTEICAACRAGNHRDCEQVWPLANAEADVSPVSACRCEDHVCRAYWLFAEGAAIDEEGRDAESTEERYVSALELDEECAETWGRYLSFLLACGRGREAEEAWAEALAAVASLERDRDRDRSFYRALHWQVALSALAHAELDLAGRVLADVSGPSRNASEQLALGRYLEANGRSDSDSSSSPREARERCWVGLPHQLAFDPDRYLRHSPAGISTVD